MNVFNRFKRIQPGMAFLLGSLGVSAAMSTDAPSAAIWYENTGIMIALIGVPGSLLVTWLTHVQTTLKERNTRDQQREEQEALALKNREDTLMQVLKAFGDSQDKLLPLVAENAAAKARYELLSDEVKELRQRDRERIVEMAKLQHAMEHSGKVQEHLDTCTGGEVCPLAHLKRSSI